MKHASHVPDVLEQCHSLDMVEKSVLETLQEMQPQVPKA
jgi:hypothetical protein